MQGIGYYEEGEYEHMMSEQAYHEAEMEEHRKYAQYVHFETLRIEDEIAKHEEAIRLLRIELENVEK